MPFLSNLFRRHSRGGSTQKPSTTTTTTTTPHTKTERKLIFWSRYCEDRSVCRDPSPRCTAACTSPLHYYYDKVGSLPFVLDDDDDDGDERLLLGRGGSGRHRHASYNTLPPNQCSYDLVRDVTKYLQRRRVRKEGWRFVCQIWDGEKVLLPLETKSPRTITLMERRVICDCGGNGDGNGDGDGSCTVATTSHNNNNNNNNTTKIESKIETKTEKTMRQDPPAYETR